MPIVEARCLLPTHAAHAFRCSQDASLRKAWDPFVRQLDGYGALGRGSRVLVRAWHGLSMEVEYVAWQAPERAAIRMVRGPRMLATFAGSWAFVECADGVDARFRYLIKAAPLWRWCEALMCRYFAWEARRRLAAFKHYLQSAAGEPK
ncbi:SRPBCC family protein [Chitinimonas sp.]|uniref:SRPBCC family protein n=1 Tax=Chitinimonas sp. TaxID=1934313 RepID=UPI0035AFED2D